MILRVKVTSKQTYGRNVSWIRDGVWFDSGESKEVDFTELPGFKESEINKLTNMRSEITAGLIALTVITDLPVEKPRDILVEKVVDKPVAKPAAATKTETKEPVKINVQDLSKDQAGHDNNIFVKGSLEDHIPKSKPFGELDLKDIRTVQFLADPPPEATPNAETGEKIFTPKVDPATGKPPAVEVKSVRRAGRPASK